MQTPGPFNWTVRSNSTFTQPTTYKDSSGTVVNLSAYSARLQIRTSDGTLVTELNTANGGITLAATSPNITWTMSTTAIGAIAVGGYVYDLCLFSGAGYTGTETCLLAGEVTVTAGVTV